MKNPKVTLLIWFLMLASLIYAGPWWFTLATPWRILSMTTAFLATCLLIVNYNLKNFGNFFRREVVSRLSPFAGDTSLVEEVVKWHTTFRRKMAFFLFLALVYWVTAVSACPVLEVPSQLYLYIAGWAIICLLLNEQIRTYILVSALMNELDLNVRPLSAGSKNVHRTSA